MEFIGGQAVIEGVLMKNKNKIAIAVRTPNGKIKVKKETLPWKEIKTPFIRGIWNLFLVMYVGIKALNFSSQCAQGKTEKISSTAVAGTLIFSLAFALLLFKGVPLFATEYINKATELNNYSYAFIEGIIKIALFIGYILVIRRMKDIQRVFQYHGAEHKVVNCYEAKQRLTVENAKKQTTIHTRCGTTFVIFVLFLSIFMYMFIPQDFSLMTKLGLRIMLLPLLASLSYEFLRFAATKLDTKTAQRMLAPGLMFQKLTTKEPTKEQLEVAIRALQSVA